MLGLASKILQYKGADVIAAGLCEHAHNDDVVAWCCRDISAFAAAVEVAAVVPSPASARSDALLEYQRLLDALNVPVVLTQLLERFLERVSQCDTGAVSAMCGVLRALGHIIRRNAPLRQQLVDLHFCGLLSQLLVQLRREHQHDFAEALCWLIGNTAHHSDAQLLALLGEAGACDAVALALQRGSDRGDRLQLAAATATQEALRALRYLCDTGAGDAANCRRFAELGTATLLLRVHQHYEDSPYSAVLHWVW